MKFIIKPLVFGLVCFFTGYQLAIFKQSPTLVSGSNEQATQQEKTPEPIDHSEVHNTLENESLNTSKNNSNADLITADVVKGASIDELSESLERDDVDAMLARLQQLRAEGGNGVAVAMQFDLLKGFLTENPENINNLVTQLGNQPINSNSFSTLISLIKSLPVEQTDLAVLSFAEQYAGAFDQESQDKMLAVLSTNYKPIESEYLIRSLVDMAMFEQTDMDTKLEALTLLRSHQLRESEKTTINTELSQLINGANDQEAARLVPHLLRFSKKEQRIEIVRNLLSQNNSESTRNEVLNSINSGSVPASDEMKAMLFEIAADPNDSLSHEALETLEYAFELNSQEYSRLTSQK